MPELSLGQSTLATLGVRSRADIQPDTGGTAAPVGRPSARSLVGELGSGLAALRLGAALPRLFAVPRGEGLVIDVPGWKAPEVSGAPLRGYLRALGYDARGWGFGTNTGNPRRDVTRLTERVADLADRSGAQVSLVGWSLGGVIVREVARRRPDLVDRVITYGTPLTNATLRRLDAEAPLRLPLTVMFTRRDGVVPWQSCIDHVSPQVEHVEVFSTHVGMGFDPDVWEVVGTRLAGIGAQDGPGVS